MWSLAPYGGPGPLGVTTGDYLLGVYHWELPLPIGRGLTTGNIPLRNYHWEYTTGSSRHMESVGIEPLTLWMPGQCHVNIATRSHIKKIGHLDDFIDKNNQKQSQNWPKIAQNDHRKQSKISPKTVQKCDLWHPMVALDLWELPLGITYWEFTTGSYPFL